MKLVTTLAALAVLTSTGTTRADVLWDQSNYDVFGAGFFNSVSGSPPFGLTVYTVSDITVDGSGWHVESISTYFTNIDATWGDVVSQGYLNVYPKIGSLPIDGTDVPAAHPTVAMTATDLGNGVYQVTASGLNLDIAPGDYWIGITPIAPSGFFGPEIQFSTSTFLGAEAASWDAFADPGPPAWFNFQPGVDPALLIEGTRPTPVDGSSWGQLKALYR